MDCVAIRVTPAVDCRHRRLAPEIWLLAESDLGETPKAKFYFVNLPATASLLVAKYRGHDRAMAFGIWGGVAAAASAIGPILGGFLTTHYSWRWGFRINVVVCAILAREVLGLAAGNQGGKKQQGQQGRQDPHHVRATASWSVNAR